MGETNTFEGFDAYTVRLIKYKSRRLVGCMGLTESDIEDIEQELSLHLRSRLDKHDAARGALSTFVNRVLENKARRIITSRETARLDATRHAYSLDAVRGPDASDGLTRRDMVDDDSYRISQGNAERPQLEDVEMRVDVGRVMSSLPEELQHICLMLSDKPIAVVARELGMKRSRLYETMRRLRAVFAEKGLDLYM